jgi:ABC-type glycerol-3-phosphate transport system substrate-binding protein
MISLKRTAAILLATSLLAVSMAACSKPVSTSSSSSNTSSASSDTSSVTSDTSSVTSDTSSVDSGTNSTASGTSSVTPGTSTAKPPGASSVKPGTSSAKPGITSRQTVSVAPSNSTSGVVKNMNGRTVILQSWGVDTDNGPKDKHVERGMAKRAAIQKQYNCKITLGMYENDVGNTKPVQNSVLAGKPVVDIWQMGWTDWLGAYVGGLIQPLDAFKCFNFADKTKYFNPYNDLLTVNGVHYGLMISSISGFQSDQMMFYRLDVLQKSGVTSDMMPDTLAKNGQWTWDNFAKICQKVRASGNIPLTDYAGAGGMNQINLYQDMCYTFGTDYLKQDASNRTVTFNGGSAAALSALNLYISFVKNKTIDAPDCTKTNPADMCNVDNTAFSPEICAMAKWLYPRWGTEISKANWGMVYLPKVKASDKYIVVSDKLGGGWAIPYGVKNPADAATVLQALCPFDTDYAAQKAETMIDYELWLPSNQAMADSVLRIENEINAIAYTSDQQYDITGLADGPGVSKDWLTHVQKIATGQEDAAAVIAANTGKYNNLLKNLYVIR